jgi:hypothetical protein
VRRREVFHLLPSYAAAVLFYGVVSERINEAIELFQTREEAGGCDCLRSFRSRVCGVGIARVPDRALTR